MSGCCCTRINSPRKDADKGRVVSNGWLGSQQLEAGKTRQDRRFRELDAIAIVARNDREIE